ncbi:hypothetical protein BDV24DRAFT_157008 [Aspergillus arachidicola]|uniref:HAT C-terminal dimerisation domain-containing protein n=1 Tax=Aspergillus arachidicola TaxID=656916 RepID=A0A5N6XMS9_9EURO|nr:hypothetical protein BDV24DRAFT_157008 [Aspergillus arachidicola]
MDKQDAYYVGHVLDPRFTTLLQEKELGNVSGQKVIGDIKEVLHEQCPSHQEACIITGNQDETAGRTIEAEILQKIRHPKQQRSDIDSYFDDVVVITHDPYPRIAAAARDYLAILAYEVAVERVFKSGRDLLGLRRYSLHGETMRRLV